MNPKTQTHRLIGPDPTGRYLKRRIEEPQILTAKAGLLHPKTKGIGDALGLHQPGPFGFGV